MDRILRIRRYHRLALDDLRKLHVVLRNATPYLIADDHLPSAPIVNAARTSLPEAATQLDLFAPVSALTGAL